MTLPNFKANGDINKSRFVDVAGSHLVVQSGVGSVPIGVCQRGIRDTPLPGASTLAAQANDPVQVYGPGECCPIEGGAALADGTFVKPGVGGVAVAIQGGEAYYGQVMGGTSNAGELADVYLRSGVAPTPTVAVAAAGSTKDDAAVLSLNSRNTVSAADGTKGVILPAGYKGARCTVYNQHASNGLKIYPQSGGKINDGTADAAITMEGKTVAVLEWLDSTTWGASFTVNT